MEKIIIFILFSIPLVVNGQRSPLTAISVTDTVIYGQDIVLSTTTLVDKNGSLPPLFCSNIYTLRDTIIGRDIHLNLTFDFSNLLNLGCLRDDTFRITSPPPGLYTLNLNWSKVDTAFSAVPVFYDYDTVQIVVLNSTSLEEQRLRSVELHPNSTSTFFRISGLVNFQSVKLYSLNGQLLKSYQKQEQYDVSDLSNGIYVVRGIGKEVEFHQKLVVAR